MSARMKRQVIVSGAPVVVEVTATTRFSRVVALALAESGNRGGRGTTWELRRADGELLNPDERITDAGGWRESEPLYLHPSAGAGAALSGSPARGEGVGS